MEKALEIRGLSYKYANSDARVFEDVCLDLNAGDFAIVSGYSGCGKSTFLKAINATHSPSDEVIGKLQCFGNDLNGLDASKRSKYIGSVLQNADEQIIFSKVEDEIAFPLENKASDKSEMKICIDYYSKLMHLDANSDTANLSGGQKQRLITAATLAMKQRLIILDEPLANLDKEGGLMILERLSEMCRKEDCAIILVEHRLDLVLKYANRLLYFDEGKLLEAQSIPEFEQAIYSKVDATKSGLCSADGGRTLISLNQVSYSVKEKLILSPISFVIREGEKYVITGENGCGKSTLLKILSGIIQKVSGKIRYSDDDLKRFKGLGLILQNPAYQLFMSNVRDEVFYGAKDKDFAEDLISILNLNPILDKHPHSLSEGQKRRVGVAAILATMPSVLLLDEPSVGQDYANMFLIIDAIKHLESKQALTTLTVSHDARCQNLQGDKYIKL